MRHNLKIRRTTTGRRCSRRVKWKVTENYWLALVLDEETVTYKQHGILHRQMGEDGRGNKVWPDRTIHHFRPDYIYLWALPTNDKASAEILRDGLLELVNKQKARTWSPPAGLNRGSIIKHPLSYYGMLRNGINPLEYKQ